MTFGRLSSFPDACCTIHANVEREEEKREKEKEKRGNKRLIKHIASDEHQNTHRCNNDARLLRGATGDSEDLAVDPAAVAAGEESHHASDIFGHGATTQRAVLSHEVLNLLSRPLGRSSRDVVPSVGGEHIGLDTTGSDTVDGDTTLTKVGSEGLDHTNDGHLGGVVKGVVANTEKTSGDGGHEDQTTVVLEVLPGSLANEELGTGVQVEDVVVLLLGDFLGLVPALSTTIRHDNVNLAKVLLGLLEQALNLGDLADISLDGDGLGSAAGGLDLSNDLIGGGLAALVVDDNAGTTSSELDGTTTTDTTASTSDESDLSVEGGGRNSDDALRHCCSDYFWIKR